MKTILNTKYKSALLRKAIAVGMVGFSFATIGCSDFLEKDPTFIVKENYYNNATDVEIGLAGIYDILGKEDVYGSNLPVYLTMSDEGAYYRSGYVAGPAVYVFDPAETAVANLWKHLYEGVERANVLLSRIDGVSMPIADKNAAKGQAKFLRAYYYFLLTSNWGDVPLKKVPTSSVNNVNVPKTPLKDVYEFIVEEMKESVDLVKPITAYGNAGRVSQSAVKGMLARVYLKMAGAPLNETKYYKDALEWSEKLVYPESGNYQHSLVSDFTKVWKDMAADKYNISESIWEVEFYGNRFTDFEAGRLGNTQGIQSNDEEKGYSYGFVSTTRKLYEAFEATDVRRDWSIATYKYVHTGTKVTDSTYYAATDIENRAAAKFRRTYEVVKPKNKNYTPINFPLLRFSDVLLMFAEAENHENSDKTRALEALKKVRERAHASDLTNTIGNDADLLKQTIREERFRELCFEGIRKYDLIRYGTFVTEMGALVTHINATAPANVKYTALGASNVTERNTLLPIPISELSLNNAVTQNSGW